MPEEDRSRTADLELLGFVDLPPASPRHDHTDVRLNGYFVGFRSLKPERRDHINLQRCPRCRVANYALAVTSGVCSHCGLDINDLEQVRCFLESSTQSV